MRAFLLGIGALVVVSTCAAFVLDTLDWSAADVYSTEYVRR
ncbi:MAG: hypothetical protein AB7L41_10985 [Flavobacteriaceae bacterium]